MQIHELNTFVGTPGSGDYLAIDDGDETFKVGADNLGVTTQMTQAEAEAGTSTQPRVITPKVLHDYVETKEIKSVSKRVSTDNAGNVTLFGGQTVNVLAVVDTNSPAPVCFSPFHGYGNTYAKAFLAGGSTPAYAINVSDIDVTIYYL